MNNAVYQDQFTREGYHTSSFDWRATFAGSFVALLTYIIFMTLGIAIASGTLPLGVDTVDTQRTFGIGSAVWTVFATSISLFTGAYVAGRVGVRKFVEARLGWIHGAVVSALFFTFLFIQVGAAITAASQAFGVTMNTLMTAGGDVASLRIACWTVFGSTLIGTGVALYGGVVGAQVQIGETKRVSADYAAVVSTPVHS